MKFDEKLLNNFFETELHTTKGVVSQCHMEGQGQKLMTKLKYPHPHFDLKNDEKIFIFFYLHIY